MQSFRGADGNTCQPLTSPCNLPLGMLYEIHQQVTCRSSAGRGELSQHYLSALSVEPDALLVSRKVLLFYGRTLSGPSQLTSIGSFHHVVPGQNPGPAAKLRPSGRMAASSAGTARQPKDNGRQIQPGLFGDFAHMSCQCWVQKPLALDGAFEVGFRQYQYRG